MSVKSEASDQKDDRRSPISYINDGYIYNVNDAEMSEYSPPNHFTYPPVPDIGQQFSPGQLAALNSRRGSDGTASVCSNKTTRSTASHVSRSRRAIHTFTSHAQTNYSDKQKEQLASFSSLNYSPTHSQVYKDWLRDHPPKFGFDRWILMILSGLLIGLMAALLKQCLTALANLKWEKTKEYARDGDLEQTFAWTAGISIILVVISSVSVVFIYPPACGSGVPEILAYLNGVVVHGTLNLKYFVVKFISLVFAVSSGLPAAIQGPVIAMGGVVGHGVGQFQSKTLGINPTFFSRFRNAEDRRSFATAGVAAGVAAAFNAPIGGLLFAMEDLASFWSNKLSWQTFFCCAVATGTANLINTAFSGFIYQGLVGRFNVDVPSPVAMNVSILPCAVALGIVGGVLGAAFTHLNYRILQLRAFLVSKIPHPTAAKFARVLETVLLVLIMAMVVSWYPTVVECSTYDRNLNNSSDGCSVRENEFELEEFNCHQDDSASTIQYNEIATMLMQSGTDFFNMLTEREHERRLGWQSMLMVLPIWFLMTAWTAGSAVAGGTFVPLLCTGALMGRSAGEGLLELYAYLGGENYLESGYWNWMDPGLVAIIGAGSVLAGVQRLVLTTTVIIIEMTRDINIILPLITAIFCSKLFADFLSKPLYQYQLQLKALPYLESSLKVVIDGEVPDMELFSASDIMATPVKTIRSVESVANLSRLLIETEHCGFPVIKYDDYHPYRDDFLHADENPAGMVCGLLTRVELMVILCSEQVYNVDKVGSVITPNIDYEELSVDYLADPSKAMERTRTYAKFPHYQRIFINLTPFINMSAAKVEQSYSLNRTYSLFRTLGLRHLMVTDVYNQLQGIITRKDLMAFSVTEKLTVKSALQRITSLSEQAAGNDIHEREKLTVLPAIVISGEQSDHEEHTTL